MSRTRGKTASHARHRKVIKAARGYYGRRKNTFRAAQSAVVKAGQYAYVGRKLKKRDFRALWIQRINAAVRALDPEMNYSRFMCGLSRSGLELNRKTLSELAIREPAAFQAVFDEVRTALK